MKLFSHQRVKRYEMSAETDKERRFVSIIENNRGVITKVCYMYATDREHFKDLYQETLVNLWRGIDSFRGDSTVSTWIYRTAINTCLTIFRRSRNDRATVSLDVVADMAASGDERPALLKEMYRLISHLESLDKAIIMLWLDERTYDEIAEITGLPRNTIATRLRRIKQRLVSESES